MIAECGLGPTGLLHFLHLHTSVHFLPERKHGHLTMVVYLLSNGIQCCAVDSLSLHPQQHLNLVLSQGCMVGLASLPAGMQAVCRPQRQILPFRQKSRTRGG